MWSAMDGFVDYRYTRFDATELRGLALRSVHGEIGESAESRSKCLEDLRTKLKELEDVYPCLDDSFLLRFLRVTKFNSSRAFTRMKKFYEKQEIQQKAFENCRLTFSKVLQFPYLKASPYRMKDNSALIMSKFATVDPSKISFDEKFYVELIVYSHLITNPVTQMCGVTIVIDFTGYNLRGFLSHSPNKLQLFLDTFQNSFPLRIKALHILNTPHIFKAAYNLAYPFLSKKLQSRLILHTCDDNWNSLHKSVPAEILSEEYGGQLKQFELIDLLANVRQLDKDYRKQLKFGLVKTRLQRERFTIFKDE